METSAPLNWRKILVHGVVAGLIGGVLLDLFFYATILPEHQSISVLWQYMAAAALGQSAFSNPNGAWLGFLINFCVSIGWGVAFSYVAHTRPGVSTHPYISGVVFGIVVMIIMQIVTMVANLFAVPTVTSFLMVLIGFCAFFGLPVSLYVTRAMRA